MIAGGAGRHYPLKPVQHFHRTVIGAPVKNISANTAHPSETETSHCGNHLVSARSSEQWEVALTLTRWKSLNSSRNLGEGGLLDATQRPKILNRAYASQLRAMSHSSLRIECEEKSYRQPSQHCTMLGLLRSKAIYIPKAE